MIVTFGNLFKRSCKTESALNSGPYSINVTCSTIPDKSISASTPELHHQITNTLFHSFKVSYSCVTFATILFLIYNDVQSQYGQYTSPFYLNSSSPGTPTLRQLAPFEMITDLLLRTAPFSSSTSIKPFFFRAVAVCKFIISIS